MNNDITKYIYNNFKGISIEEIRKSIEDSINQKDEIVLPGLGVLFIVLWNNSNEEIRNKILNNLSEGFNK